jgi:very-short-patch-repair endonuclease
MQALAGRQNAVITHRQLRAIGLSASAIDRRIRSGHLHPKHRGVYAVGRPDLTIEGEFHAAVLSIGEGAVLSHLSAAKLLGFWNGRTDPIEVIVPRRVRSRPGIRVRHAKHPPPTRVVKGIPVTTAAHTVLDCSETMYSQRAFRRLVHEAEVQGKTNSDDLLAELKRFPRHPGAPRLKAEIADGAKPTRSGMEDDVVDILRRNKFPQFESNVHVPGTPPWVEVDVFFPDHRLAIEVDGDPWHATKFRRKLDAYKQALIEAAGVRVMRLTEDDVANERRTLARVRHALD